MSTQSPGPSAILSVATAFWASKALLSAAELDLFTKLHDRALTGEALARELELHPRANPDFFDALAALGFLMREGDGPTARYRNTADCARFLDKASSEYIGGFVEMLNARLYGFWGNLTEALRTGKPQNERKNGGQGTFDAIYADPARLEQFLDAMTGISTPNIEALADRFDFSPYRTLCDVGGASGRLATIVARRHPHLHCITADLPAVTAIARKKIAAQGLSDRVEARELDFFAQPFPRADVITMGLILHDWNLDKRMQLIRCAYDALPAGGAYIVIELMIDDARREPFGLLSSLNMLIEFGDAFDYTAADFDRWSRSVGFRRTEKIPLNEVASAAVAYK
jgi:hypothetical protein